MEFFIMKKLLGLILAASMLLIGVNSVYAEDVKGLEIKSMFSGDKADGSIAILQSGATVPSKARPARVVYVIQGGNLERIYPDGKIVKKHYKTGIFLPIQINHIDTNTAKLSRVL